MNEMEDQFKNDKGIKDAQALQEIKDALELVANLSIDQLQALRKGGFSDDVATSLAASVYSHLMERTFHHAPATATSILDTILGGGL